MELINGDNTTYIIKGYDSSSSSNLFTGLIPSTVTSIIFTDIDIAIDATLIDEDGDGGVVAWLDTSDNTKMYVSTQYAGIKVEGNSNSSKLFYNNSNLTELNLSNFDTTNTINMQSMFSNCTNLASLDLTNFNTIKVGNKFKWITTLNKLGLVDGTWQDEEGNTYTSSDTFPSNVAHTYTKVS